MSNIVPIFGNNDPSLILSATGTGAGSTTFFHNSAAESGRPASIFPSVFIFAITDIVGTFSSLQVNLEWSPITPTGSPQFQTVGTWLPLTTPVTFFPCSSTGQYRLNCTTFTGGTSFNVYASIAASMPQGTGGGSGSNVNIIQAAGVALTGQVAGSLPVTIVSGAGSGGTASADEAVFTEGTTNLTPVGGEFNSASTNLATGHTGAVRMTADRNFMVDVEKFGAVTISTGTGASGTGIPRVTVSNDTELQLWDGTTGPVKVSALTNAKVLAVEVMDGSGNQITSFGGGSQFAMGSVQSSSALGTIALGYDGTNVRGLLTSSTGQLHTIIDSATLGTVAVSQTGSPWGIIGTTADGATAETNILVVGGESNDATAQYQPIPLGAGGRSVIIEGFTGGTAVPVTLTSTTITGAVAVTQSTSPWIVAGAKTPADSYTNPIDAEDTFALLGGWDATNTKWQRVQVDAGTGTLKVDPGTVTVIGTITANQGGAPWSQNLTQVAGTALGATAVVNFGTAPAAAVVPGVNASLFSGITSLTNTSGALDVNLKTSSITLPVSIAANLTVVGAAAADAAQSGNPVLVAGVDNSGNIQEFGIADAASAAPVQTLLVGGMFQTSPPTLSTGQAQQLQMDNKGNLLVNLNANSFGTVTVSGTVTANQGTANVTPWNENVAQFGGTNVSTGTGASGTGIPRVTVSNDSQVQIWDGTTAASFEPASEQAVAADTSLVVQINPNQPALTTPWAVNAIQAAGVAFSGQVAGSLPVTIVSGAGSGGTASVDEATFTLGTTNETPVGGVNTGLSNTPTVAQGQTGAVQITSDRKQVVYNPQENTLIDLVQTLILEVRAMRSAVVAMVTENADWRTEDFDPANLDYQPVN